MLVWLLQILHFNLSIRRPLLSAGVANVLQLTSTSVTGILHMLPFIFNDLPFGITVTFLNKILLNSSSQSGPLTPWNCFGKSSTQKIICTYLTWHYIVSRCFITRITNIIIAIIWHHHENGIFINIVSTHFLKR